MPLLTVVLAPGSVLADAVRALGLAEDEVDGDYGLIDLDPGTGRFALRVESRAAARLAADPAVTVFADPSIGPAGADHPGESK